MLAIDNERPLADRQAGFAGKVLLVAASLRYMGGQSVMAGRLVHDLRRDGISVDFLPVDPTPPRLLYFLDRIKYVRTILRSIAYVRSLFRLLPNYDVVHVFSASYTSFLISPAPAILISHWFGKPCILNYRSGEADDHLKRAGRLTRWLLSLPTVIVVPSGYLVSIFKRINRSATAIPNHVNTSMFQFRERATLQPRIVVSRALEELYNIPCALRAFRLFQDKYPDATMKVLGDGPQRQSLQALAADLQLSGVTFTGRIERTEIARYYEEADIFLNTSSIDNMPVSILEAFAAGLPIVTTNAGGIPHMIVDRQNGHLVTVNDHQAVADRLVELMENPRQALRFSLAGKEEMQNYTWEAVAPRWKYLYSRLAQSSESKVARAANP